MSFAASAETPDRILFADPIAMSCDGGTQAQGRMSGLGLFPDRGTQLGFFGIDDAIIAAAIPTIGNLIRGANKPGIPDPVAAVWQNLPPEQINAYKGSDGWWYDQSDDHRLSHEEAAQRQQQVVAASIGATVDLQSGWWKDDIDGHQLTHAEAWGRYQELAAGQPISRKPVQEFATGTSGGPFPTTPIGKPRVQQAGLLGGLSLSNPILLGGLALVAFLAFTGRRSSR